jgi:importin subunit alpha-1
MNPQEVIDMTIVPYFVEFFFQFEAMWVFIDNTSGTTEQTKVVVDNPILVKLLPNRSASVRKEAVWVLSNIARDSPAFRDLVLEAGVMDPLVNILQTSENQLSMIRNSYGKPQPKFKRVRVAFPVLMELLSRHDEDVYGHSCWTLFHLTNGPEDKIKDLIDDGVCSRLIKLLEKPSRHMQKHAYMYYYKIYIG